MNNIFEGKTILVTGGTGSVGSEIVRCLLEHNPKTVRIMGRDDTGLFNMDQELKSEKMRFFIGDIRDKDRLKRAISGVDIIFHAAALKHVPLCEYNPFEAIKTNVIGLQNVLEVAMDEGTETLINISTDKAVNPGNVMGATKLLAERLVISANNYRGAAGKPAFSCVRFGNVLNSRGSVVPVFRNQAKNGGPLTVTDLNMTRFMMGIREAAMLVLKATEIATGGEIFILKLPVVRIGDLAKAIIEEVAQENGFDPKEIGIKVTGRRAGEKLDEQLMTDEEANNAYENEKMLIVLPQHQEISLSATKNTRGNLPDYFKKVPDGKYSSGDITPLSIEAIKKMIDDK
ncbi:UDP-N-acetylglucosamine 4,6-dehydratase family protein [Chloroflexota bacterium]